MIWTFTVFKQVSTTSIKGLQSYLKQIIYHLNGHGVAPLFNLSLGKFFVFNMATLKPFTESIETSLG